MFEHLAGLGEVSEWTEAAEALSQEPTSGNDAGISPRPMQTLCDRYVLATICRSPPYAAAQSLSALSSHSKSCTLNQLTEHISIVMLFRSSIFTDHPIFMT